jgi:hypothetical protein
MTSLILWYSMCYSSFEKNYLEKIQISFQISRIEILTHTGVLNKPKITNKYWLIDWLVFDATLPIFQLYTVAWTILLPV